MKRILLSGVVAAVILAGILPQIGQSAHEVNENLDGVNIFWEGGTGLNLVLVNDNNYSIYNVSLDSISISGFVIGGLENNEGATISEVPPEANVSFGSLMMGIGPVEVTANISYDEQGEHISREITGNFFFLGFLILPM